MSRLFRGTRRHRVSRRYVESNMTDSKELVELAKRGGLEMTPGSSDRAADKKFVIYMTGALRLSDDDAERIIRSAWTVAGPPLADWGKGVGLLMNDGLGQRMLDEEVAKFQERAAALAAAPAPAPAAAPPATTPATALHATPSTAAPATARAQPVDVSAPAPAPDILPWRPSARKKRKLSPSPSQPAYCAMPERPLPIEGRASKLPAERGPGDGVGKGAVLRMFYEGFGWATGHVQFVTRDGAVDVFWVSDTSYSTITRSVAAAHVVLPALVSAPMHA